MRQLILLALLAVSLPTQLHAQAGDGRLYVRRIEFLGTDGIDDEVLRRELTQLEGTHVNTSALEESRRRLERLPYVERAEISQRPVTDAPDQVDILVTITEAPPRQYRFGGAYSESLGVSGFGYFINENLFGTGQRFFAQLEVSEFHTDLRLSHTDPFVHPEGVSRSIAVSSRRFDQLTADTTELDGDLARTQLVYSYQIAERQAIRMGIALQDTDLATGPFASTQLDYWVSNNGNPVAQGSGSSTDYLTAELLFGWHYDTRDNVVFPNSGTEQSLGLNVAVPGSEVEYYSLNYELDRYWRLRGGWTARLGARLGYGSSYGSATTSLPPNLNWFAGGPNSVRGYRENRLGPKDSLGNPYGGNLFAAGQLELMMPLPEKWQKRLRLALFYDIGNVFSTEDIGFQDDTGQVLDYGFAFSGLRQSAGISARIRLPIGLLRLSYGVPLDAADDDPNPFLRDDVERFQVAVGVEF